MKKFLMLLACVALATTAFGATIVDIYSTNALPQITAGPGGSASNVAQAGVPVLGVTRQIGVASDVTSLGDVSSKVQSTHYIVSADFATSGYGWVDYASTYGDLTGHWLSASLDAFSNVQPGAQMNFYAYAGATLYVSSSFALTAGSTYQAILASFVAPGDLANITRVGMTTTMSAASDIAYDRFMLTNVPEPGTYALMGAGLAALAFLRRRK